MHAVTICSVLLFAAGSALAAKPPRRALTAEEHRRFMQSVERCDLEAVRGFLDSGVSPSGRGASPASPLEVAVRQAEKPACEAVANLLLERGASGRVQTEVPLVLLAQQKGRAQLAQRLIQNGAVDCSKAVAAAGKGGDVRVLQYCGDTGVPVLAEALSRGTGDPILLANVLSAIGPPAKQAIPALRNKLGQREVGLYAAAALLRIDPSLVQEAAPALLRHLEDKDPYLNAFALETIAAHGLTVQVPVEQVAVLANHRDENLRLRAVAVLEQQAESEALQQRIATSLDRCGKAISRACDQPGCSLAADFDRDKRLDFVALVRTPGGTRVAVVPGRGRCKLTRLPFGGVEVLRFDDDGRSLGFAVESGERYATGRVKNGAVRWTFPRTD